MCWLRGNKTYRRVPEGSGDVYRIRPYIADNGDIVLTPYIGTRGLLTCVGLYFRIDYGRCFLAHIFAHITTQEEMTCTEGQGLRIRRAVRANLQRNAEQYNWRPDNPKITKSLFIACPQLGKDDRKKTGSYVVQGIADFFNLQTVTVYTGYSGFIVNKYTDVVQGLTYQEAEEFEEDEVQPPELAGFDEVMEPSTNNWSIGVS